MVIVTLLTDFGLNDSYVAQMKGIIHSDCPGCEIVDVSHNVQRHSIVEGAFLLETAVPYFPPGTIHVAVVDPGVGSKRLPIFIKCKTATLVGPDNGVLDRAANKLGLTDAFRIRTSQLGPIPASSTFHGRDIFARTAALLAGGRSPTSVGLPLFRTARLELPKPRISSKHLACVVLHVDIFGNVITNAANILVQKRLRRGQALKVESPVGRWKARYVRTYSDVRLGELAVLLGSQGYVELAVREENASELLGLKVLDQLEFSSAG